MGIIFQNIEEVRSATAVADIGSDAWKNVLRQKAHQLGFLDARVASTAIPAAAGVAYTDWVEAGCHGEMSYMERLAEERSSTVDHILPGAKSVIVLAASYWYPDEENPSGAEATSGLDEDPEQKSAPGCSGIEKRVRVARYALGRDYHYVLKERLTPLIEWLEGQYPEHKFRPCVDSAPVLERAYAAASGIGFIGKNTMVISWMHGSFTFLCEIVTTATIEPDAPREGTCGNCTRCLDACPTQAFPRPGVLDARKCISYLTIEKKTELTRAESAATGEWAFGCDICQDVCPYNKAPEVSLITDFAPGTVVNRYESADTFLEPASNRQFERRFAASPILRPGKHRVQALMKSKM